jgi:hypothetical protein
MFRLGRPELIILFTIVGVLLMQNPHLRKLMLVVLLGGVIIAAFLPAAFVAVMTATLVVIAALGVSDLLKRA